MQSPSSPGQSDIIEQVFALSRKLRSVSKFRWGLSMVASYVAIPIFPIVTTFAHLPPSVGTAIAAAFSLLGNFLRWHSESLRLDSEDLLGNRI